jgi:hypothetical protein
VQTSIPAEVPKNVFLQIQPTEARHRWTHKIIQLDNKTPEYQYTPIITMTTRSLMSIDKMLLVIPVPVRTALEDEFHLQVTTAYAKHLKEELAAVQATVSQAALPPLPQIVTKVAPGKTAKP